MSAPTVASENRFPLIRLTEGSAPATPPSGEAHLYADSSGVLHWKDDAGAVHDMGAGYTPGGTDVAVADGGTGASSASVARTNLGLIIGTDVQAFDADIPTVAASQAEMEAGSSTSLRSMTPQRVAQAIAALAAGGGGGGARTHYGYGTLGATDETMTTNRVYLKTFTTVAAGLAFGLRLYMKETSDSVGALYGMLYADNAGAVGNLIGSGRSPSLAPTKNVSFASDFRWLSVPFGPVELAATTAYWMAWMVISELAGTPTWAIKYDAGSDRYWGSGGTFVTDGGRYSETNSSRKYSAEVIVQE